jgi:hypothetical protein
MCSTCVFKKSLPFLSLPLEFPKDKMGEMRNTYKIFIGKPKETNHLRNLHVGGRISKRILKKKVGGY